MSQRRKEDRIQCPKCKEPIFAKVLEVRQEFGTMIRKRECEKCGSRFITREQFIGYSRRRAASKNDG